MASSPTALVFTVQRHQPELVTPAKATPHEFLELSDIDDQQGLRIQIPGILIYRYDPSMQGRDPVNVIREAIAKTLVFYYPFAGRLREGPGRKLMLECTGEGILFIEADADVTLQQFGDVLHPPFPCLEELLYNVPGSDGILNCPLLLIQVTRLKCGGFIFAMRNTHTMSDATGLVQFLTAVGETACGELVPSVQPVWQRELLKARDPPRVTCRHREYDEVADTNTKGVAIIPPDDMDHRSFVFKAAEMSAIRRFVPHHLIKCTTFEVLTACLWRCRTMALQKDPDEEVRVLFPVNARAKFKPSLPNGYYGNVIGLTVAVTTAGRLCQNPLGYALELVRQAKDDVTEEYMRSLADLVVIRGRPHYMLAGTYIVSDLRRVGFGGVDFGWGKAAYGGVAMGAAPGVDSCYVPFKDNAGQDGIVVPVSLPAPAMERFIKELYTMLKAND